MLGDVHGPGAPLRTTADALARAERAGRVILVEGISDRIALETLAGIEGVDLSGTVILPAGGAQAIGPHLARFGPRGTGTLVGGLCDAAEAGFFLIGLRRAGFDTVPPEGALARHGFRICECDLEDELLRALGPGPAEEVIAAEGEGVALATLAAQGSWHDAPRHERLRRFLSGRAGRKARYARVFTEAIPRGRHPAPLRAVLGLVPAGSRAGPGPGNGVFPDPEGSARHGALPATDVATPGQPR